MIIDLDRHPDQGCWISDDRVNAFVSAAAGGIGEIGFHGLQPVSRNSRLLVRPEGVLGVLVGDEPGTLVHLRNVEWHPGTVRTSVVHEGREYGLGARASGRSVTLSITSPRGAADNGNGAVRIRFSFGSLFAGVHGVRTWSTPRLENHALHCSCRDRIILRDWLRRTGPYAGDFLIPEPWRRLIFRRRCRSGLATIEDVRQEFRDSDVAICDAQTWLTMEGEGFTAVQDDDGVTFLARCGSGDPVLRFTVSFAESPRVRENDGQKIQGHAREVPAAGPGGFPALQLPEYPHTEEFFCHVPGVVRSSTVHDLGMTRATPGAYYWIWAWDNLVTALEMLRWGDCAAAERIVCFINSHRDTDGSIPGRWTRTLEPLDTPPAGALEFLLLLLAHQVSLENPQCQALLDVYPHARAHLDEMARRADARGLMPNLGFYPDLPARLGRTEKSAVAMEVGSTYAFSRLMELVSRQFGYVAAAERAAELAGRIEGSFASVFWNREAGFLHDAIDLESGQGTGVHPLFSLLFLQSPAGFALLRSLLLPMASFARRNFQTQHGSQLLPPGDPHRGAEAVLSSWYPHWDIYLLKLLRRAGEREGILCWLDSMERVLGRLRYAPEFLTLQGFSPDDPDSWRRHGAVWNLNCATGWYRSILEGLFGLEFDPGGMAVLPLDLGLPPIQLHGLVHRGSRWEITVGRKGEPDGDATSAAEAALWKIRIDGEALLGCTKVPARYHDGKPHRLEILYEKEGPPAGRAAEDSPVLTELVNAEVLESAGGSGSARVRIRALGATDIAFPLAGPRELLVDGVTVHYLRSNGTGYARLQRPGEHTILLLSPLNAPRRTLPPS